MTYIGTKPTINNDRVESIEVHVFDFEGNLYDKTVKIRFVKRIRDERIFENLEVMRRQLEIDEKDIREIL